MLAPIASYADIILRRMFRFRVFQPKSHDAAVITAIIIGIIPLVLMTMTLLLENIGHIPTPDSLILWRHGIDILTFGHAPSETTAFGAFCMSIFLSFIYNSPKKFCSTEGRYLPSKLLHGAIMLPALITALAFIALSIITTWFVIQTWFGLGIVNFFMGIIDFFFEIKTFIASTQENLEIMASAMLLSSHLFTAVIMVWCFKQMFVALKVTANETETV